MPSPINYNKLLAELNSASTASSDNSFLNNVEKSTNYLVQNVYHVDDGISDKTVKITNPTLIMFNAVVNDGFERSNRKLELGALAENIATTKLPFRKHVFENNGIAIQVKKITGRKGRFQPAFTITDTYSKTGANVFNNGIFILEFLVAVSLGAEVVNASVSLFANGKMKLSGGYLNQHNDNMNNEEYFEAQPELIREYIVDNFTDKEKFLRNSFKFNNVVAETRINKGFNLPLIQDIETRFKNFPVQYDPEISPNLFIKYGAFSFVFSQKGIVKMQNLKEHDDVEEAYGFVVKFVNALSEYEKLQKANARGQKPRLLKNMVINEDRLKRQKEFNPNRPAPEVSRRGTSCPKSRCPKPYSMQGVCPKEGYYVRPNPQGQPCCYKIPKNTKYSEKKVAANFGRANVKVPAMVRKVFNFGQNTNNKRNNTSHAKINNITVKMNSKVGLKIGSRQCMRYSKVALVDIAHRLGLPVTPGMDRPKLCGLIQTVAKNVTNTNNVKGALVVKFKMNSKNYVVTGNSPNSLKIAGRIAKTIKKEKLIQYALRLRGQATEASTISQLCKVIFDRMVALRPKPKTPSPKAKSRTPSPTPNANESALAQLRKLRLTRNLVEEDVRKFVGPEWIKKKGVTNATITKKSDELYNMLANAVNTNKVALVGRNIKEFKKGLLRQWKEDTEVELRRAKYAQIPYYPNVIKAVQNFASKRNSEGKFPKNANVMKFANVRSRIASEYNPLKKLGKSPKKASTSWANNTNTNLPPLPKARARPSANREEL